MKVICLLALLVLSSSAASIEPTLPPVEEPGYWGDWKLTHLECLPLQGDYAICGAQIRFQGYQGSKDDTAANGVRFVFCSLKQWNTQNTQQFLGLKGDWQPLQMCPQNSWVNSFQVRIEPKQGTGDDTALNGLRLNCHNLLLDQNQVITVYKGLWGSWRDWHPAGLCNKSSCSLFVGAKFRFEAELVNGDNTALNGIAMFPKVYKLPLKHMRANRID